MPKQTFLNLPEEKRAAFLNIALDEFANNEYNSASITKIVEKAGIAKGSVYQYFQDKQDLFLYLVDASNQAMMGFIQQTPPPDSSADFFQTLRWQMSATVLAAQRFPIHAKLLRRAYSSPLPFQDEVFEKARQVRDQHFQALVAQAQSAGQLNSHYRPEMVVFVVQSLMGELGNFLQNKFKNHPGDWVGFPEVDATFDEVIEILKSGLA